jgi:Arc/MetJ-type ribon-helix-helix transcriptional regulator
VGGLLRVGWRLHCRRSRGPRGTQLAETANVAVVPRFTASRTLRTHAPQADVVPGDAIFDAAKTPCQRPIRCCYNGYMNVELSERAARMAKDLVHDGRFASVEDALEYGLMAIEQSDEEAEALLGNGSAEWWAEVDVMLQEAEEDIAAGRTIEVTPEFWDDIRRRGRERLRSKSDQIA